MWNYDRRLMYPVKIKNKNPELAKFVIAQYGGAYCKCLSSPANAAKTRILETFHLLLLL